MSKYIKELKHPKRIDGEERFVHKLATEGEGPENLEPYLPMKRKEAVRLKFKKLLNRSLKRIVSMFSELQTDIRCVLLIAVCQKTCFSNTIVNEI